jgi:hypothetical protein
MLITTGLLLLPSAVKTTSTFPRPAREYGYYLRRFLYTGLFRFERRRYVRLNTGLLNVPVLSEKASSSIPKDRRMLRYIFDNRDSPSRQY